VDAPILRKGEKAPSAIYLKRCVHPEGSEAVTRFVVERRFEKETTAGSRFALVRAYPLTGRTHQIRVHLAHAGFPIVGDKIYGPDERCYLEFIETSWSAALQKKLLLPRHALHSERLRVEMEGEVYDWRAPLPFDLGEFLGLGNI
jgi:23S rRNA pseudouridine1911/1915/1917 synthase